LQATNNIQTLIVVYHRDQIYLQFAEHHVDFENGYKIVCLNQDFVWFTTTCSVLLCSGEGGYGGGGVSRGPGWG